MTKPNAEELDMAMYMAAIVVAAAEGATECITDEQRARLKTWHETHLAPEAFNPSMAKITEKDLMEHVLCKLGV